MDTLSEIKQRLDIVDIINSYTPVKKSGRNFKGLCPFHLEKTPSFMVSPELQMYKCFGCGAAGDIYKFIQTIEGISFHEALEKLAERAGVVLTKSDYDDTDRLKKKIIHINETAAKFYHYILTKLPAGNIGLSYLKTKRNLLDSTINEFMLGYAPDSWDLLQRFMLKNGFTLDDLVLAGLIVQRSGDRGGYIDKFRGRVIFPFTGIDGKVLGFNGRTVLNKEPKYLNSPETLAFQKNTFIYGLDKSKVSIKTQGAVFVEGQLDVITAHQAGFTNVVASSGTSLTEGQLKVLSRYTKELTFCFDSDSAGIAAIYRAVSMAERLGFNVNVCSIPAPYKDLDELIKADMATAKHVLGEGRLSIYDFFVSDKLRSYSTHSVTGKKQILKELSVLFSTIQNQVVLDHYTKYLSEVLDLDTDTIKNALINGVSETDTKVSKTSVEHPTSDETGFLQDIKMQSGAYLLSLLLKAPLDIVSDFLYKLDTEDFAQEQLKTIFVTLKTFVESQKTLDIKGISANLDDVALKVFSDLLLYDANADEWTVNSARDLDTLYLRVKKDSAKYKLRFLTKELKAAELAKDDATVQSLIVEIEKIKQLLI